MNTAVPEAVPARSVTANWRTLSIGADAVVKLKPIAPA